MGDHHRVQLVVAHGQLYLGVEPRPDGGIDILRSDIGDLPSGESRRDTQPACLLQIGLDTDLPGTIVGTHRIAGLPGNGAAGGENKDAWWLAWRAHPSRPNGPQRAFNPKSGN